MTDQPAPLHVFLSDAAEPPSPRCAPANRARSRELVERLAVHPRLGIPVPGGSGPGEHEGDIWA
ncbi:hypothetical protein ACFYUY_35040 [Kitasatospora sp. NPDC004745]|uniref:hypothetical protein n=1 Tax=Kitasatospora sp. NPDC004745 TaxID=3364019 RepID=UPI0036917FAE